MRQRITPSYIPTLRPGARPPQPRDFNRERNCPMKLPACSPILEIRRHGNPTVVGFTGCDSLNEFNSEAVGAEMAVLAARLPGRRLVLDFAGIRYVTSTVLGQLVGLHRTVR